MEPIVLFTTLGPNPAPLAELLWALARQQNCVVVEAFVVVAQRGAYFLESELLVAGGPLDQLVLLLGDDLAHGPRLHIILARLPDGTPIADDEDPAHADAYQDAVWAAAQAAEQAAGKRPLVFALASGRRRTMAAMLSMAYQMLARRKDVCLDVRVDDRRAEGGSGFFFPEQTPSIVEGEKGTFDARDIEIRLVPVSLPRLRGLIPRADLVSPQAAMLAAQRAIDRVEPPPLRVDLELGACFIKGIDLELGQSQFLWFATLAIERQKGDGWTSPDCQTLRQLLTASPRPSWLDVPKLPLGFWAVASHREPDESFAEDDTLRSLRSKTRGVIRTFCERHAPMHEQLLAPMVKGAKGSWSQRIELPSERIEILDPHGWLSTDPPR